MTFSEHLLDVGADIWAAQKDHLRATPSFVEFVDWLRGQLNERGPDLSGRRQARVERLFRRTVDLEVAFFETAYESADSTSDANGRKGGA